MAKFVYKPKRTKEDVEREMQSSGFSESYLKENILLFSPKVDASNRIRILPPTWDDARIYGLNIWVHYKVGADNATVLCLKKNLGKPCPVCEAVAKENDPEFKKNLSPKRKILTYVLDRQDEKLQPRAYLMPTTVHQSILAQAVDEDTGEPLIIEDPDKGYDIILVTAGTPEGTVVKFTYKSVSLSRRESPICTDPDLYDKIIDFIVENPLPQIIVFKDYDYIEALLYGKATKHEDEVINKVEEEETQTNTSDEEVVRDELVSMGRKELIEIAVGQLGFGMKEVKNLSEEGLRTLIRENAEISEAEEEKPKVKKVNVDDIRKKWGR